MKSAYVNIKNIIDSASLSKDNTLNFENCTKFTDYNKEDKSLESVLGLKWHDNYILGTIIPYLKENSSIEEFNEEDEKKYRNRPLALSLDHYGTSDYWWIILCVNGYFNARDFSGFSTLIMPARNDIEKIIDKEIYSDSSLGEL